MFVLILKPLGREEVQESEAEAICSTASSTLNPKLQNSQPLLG